MLSPVGQQKLQSLVQTQGRASVESLVQQKDVGALEKAGFTKLDALALLDTAQKSGIDAAFKLADAAKMFGGVQNQTGAGQQAVAFAAGQKGAPNVGAGQFSALAAAKGGTALDGVDAATVKDLNLKGLSLPKEITKIADQVFAGKTTRIQVSGYSAPPGGTDYEANTSAILSKIADKMSPGFITSPTADKGSVDAMTTNTSLEKGLPCLSITAKDYIKYIDPSKFPPSIDQAKYKEMPKHVFADGAKYNQATALASNAFVAAGGRDVTVFDFMRAIEKGNPAVLLVDQSMAKALGDKAVWDADKNRVNNGSQYLAEQLASFLKDGSLPHAAVSKDGFGTFDASWLQEHKAALQTLVKTVPYAGAADVDSAVAAATAHLSRASGAKNYGALLAEPAVVGHAASLTHNIWLEGGNKPGIRLVKDKDGNPDVLTSMKKSGVDWSRHGIDLAKITPEQGKDFLAKNGIELGGSNRTFAFKAGNDLRPVAQNAAEQKLLDFIGADVVAKQMKGNNEAAILGVAKPLQNVLSGVKPTFIQADADYLSAAKDVYARPASTTSATVNKADVQKLLDDVKAYAAALGKEGADLVAIGKQFPVAHAVAGAVHDDFTGYRKSNDVYMDDSQVVPYEKLSAGVAKLDCDPIIATLTASLAAL